MSTSASSSKTHAANSGSVSRGIHMTRSRIGARISPRAVAEHAAQLIGDQQQRGRPAVPRLVCERLDPADRLADEREGLPCAAASARRFASAWPYASSASIAPATQLLATDEEHRRPDVQPEADRDAWRVLPHRKVVHPRRERAAPRQHQAETLLQRVPRSFQVDRLDGGDDLVERRDDDQLVVVGARDGIAADDGCRRACCQTSCRAASRSGLRRPLALASAGLAAR